MKTHQIMIWVMLALVPGTAAMTYVLGVGVLWNLILLSIACVLCEALISFARGNSGQAVLFALKDCSALVTAWLMAICLPPFCDLSLLLIAAVCAIGLAKQAYGGLGHNLFNPAMVGYAVVLVSFPQALANWPALAQASPDALSGATLLTEFRYRQGLTTEEFSIAFGQAVGEQKLIVLSFLIGGLLLTYRRLLAWRIPAGMFAGILIAGLFGYDSGSSASLGSPWFHWTTGGFMAAAFFIATDPVTHPRGPRQQLIFGATIGIFIYLIRGFGAYPDGIAFAILFGNCLTPFLNRFNTGAAKTEPVDRAEHV
ncbi:MAG: RnfABCDGE type electron transport complex subunit D [bacterium]